MSTILGNLKETKSPEFTKALLNFQKSGKGKDGTKGNLYLTVTLMVAN